MTGIQLKLIGAGVAAILLCLLIFSWVSRGNKIDELRGWQQTVRLATTNATVEPDKNGKRKLLDIESIVPAIDALHATAESCSAKLDEISAASEREAEISSKLDSGLSDFLKQADKSFAGQREVIEDLATRKSTGDPAADCKLSIEGDSETPWDGWRK